MTSRGRLLVKLAQQQPEVDTADVLSDNSSDNEVLATVGVNELFELPNDILSKIDQPIIKVKEGSEMQSENGLDEILRGADIDISQMRHETEANIIEEIEQEIQEDANEIEQETDEVLDKTIHETVGDSEKMPQDDTDTDPEFILKEVEIQETDTDSDTNMDRHQHAEEQSEEINLDNIQETRTQGSKKMQFRKLNQLKRLHGEEYKGYKRSAEGIITYNIQRKKRGIQNRCTHTEPKKITKRSLCCAKVSEESRQKLFDYFWNLARRSYIGGLVTSREILRRRKGNNSVRKKVGHDCYIAIESGEKVLVCRKMLLNTLNLGRDTFQRWCKQFNENNDENLSDDENRDKNQKISKSRQALEKAKSWLQSLPKVPSHYCRASSKKVYLESVFRSKLHIYQVYSQFCKKNKIKPISFTYFKKLLKSENLAIHKPRKDQCDTCCSWKVKSITEDEYKEHIEKKNEAEKAKKQMKETMSNEKLVVTMDLQSVLLAPKLEASAVYYKQKLQVHDFTIYALNDKTVDLYVWHESNGNVTANEFTTCIVHYIKHAVIKMPSLRHVVLISDGCGYQNRNKILSSALLRLAVDQNITIEQLILERGHTMMEADSVHSSLEAHFKPPIFAPCDYISRMRDCRSHQPYNVHNLDYTFFLNYEKVASNRKSIRPNKPAKVTDIRAILYLPNGEMNYKLRHPEQWTAFPKERVQVSQTDMPQPLYDRPIKITKQKFLHLQELKPVMEKDYHHFYDALPHQN